MEVINWLNKHWLVVAIITGGLFVLVVLQRLLGRLRLRNKQPQLHPKLQAYAGRSEEDIEKERQDAENIIATSSTAEVAGYEITQQIEAVFVDGRRSPQEAVTGLKAEAGRRGANAIINLSHQRTAAGKCSAQGDAVLIQPVVAAKSRRSPGPQPRRR